MAYHFNWTCAYQNETWFDVHGDGQKYSVSVRHSAPDWMRKYHSCGDVEYASDIIGMVGVLRREHDCSKAIPQDVVDAFNTWREAEYWTHRRDIDAQPNRYDMVDWDVDPVFAKPVPVVGARAIITRDGPRYEFHGWQVNGEGEIRGGKPSTCTVPAHLAAA